MCESEMCVRVICGCVCERVTHAMATLLPSMMMCRSSARPGSLGSDRVYGVRSDW